MSNSNRRAVKSLWEILGVVVVYSEAKSRELCVPCSRPFSGPRALSIFFPLFFSSVNFFELFHVCVRGGIALKSTECNVFRTVRSQQQAKVKLFQLFNFKRNDTRDTFLIILFQLLWIGCSFFLSRTYELHRWYINIKKKKLKIVNY